MDHHSAFSENPKSRRDGKGSVTAQIRHMTAEFTDGCGNVGGKISENMKNVGEIQREVQD